MWEHDATQAGGQEDANAQLVKVVVGEEEFVVPRDTLVKGDPECMLARMFSQDEYYVNTTDADGCTYIDRDGTHFHHILHFLETRRRRNSLVVVGSTFVDGGQSSNVRSASCEPEDVPRAVSGQPSPHEISVLASSREHREHLCALDEVERAELLTEAEFYCIDSLCNLLRQMPPFTTAVPGSQSPDIEWGSRGNGDPGIVNIHNAEKHSLRLDDESSVSSDVQSRMDQLFKEVSKFKPRTIDLQISLKPFIPEMIPSIGEVDAFLKVSAPDGDEAPGGQHALRLGFSRLDEPSVNHTDAMSLDLRLRATSKAENLHPAEVAQIRSAKENTRLMSIWLNRMEELRRSKPHGHVQLPRNFPSIEDLMAVWPAEFEEFLQNNELPNFAELDMDLHTCIRLILCLLDVPVQGPMVDSLYLVFLLFAEFKSNPYFASLRSNMASPSSQ